MITNKKIVESTVEPNKNDLWINKGVLKSFSSAGWKNISNVIEFPDRKEGYLYLCINENRKMTNNQIHLTKEELNIIDQVAIIFFYNKDRVVPFYREYSNSSPGYNFIHIAESLTKYILYYNKNNNRLEWRFSYTNLPGSATTSKFGLVKQASGINNIPAGAAPADFIDTFNKLLYSLRDAGILEDS